MDPLLQYLVTGKHLLISLLLVSFFSSKIFFTCIFNKMNLPMVIYYEITSFFKSSFSYFKIISVEVGLLFCLLSRRDDAEYSCGFHFQWLLLFTSFWLLCLLLLKRSRSTWLLLQSIQATVILE